VTQNGAGPVQLAREMTSRVLRHPVVHGHPLHAIASDFPVTLIPTAFTASLLAGARRRPRGLETLASWTARSAFIAAAAAGAAGWWDWLTMPSEHPSRRITTIHGLINTAALGGLGVASLTSGHRRSAILGATTAGLLVSAWLGGEIVFHHGWRVRPAEEAEIVGTQLEQRGMADILAEARREVSEFEQRETYAAPRAT